MADRRGTICHVIYRLDYGGLENGLVNLINQLPEGKWDHVILTLDGFSDYKQRLPPSIDVRDLRKKPGLDFSLYLRLWKEFRRIKPSIVHTRNLATLEAQLPAMLAGIKHRIHGEHGRDVHDLDNENPKYRLLRKFFSFIVKRYTTVSRDLEDYLLSEVGIAPHKVIRICNGVDTDRFAPRSAAGPNWVKDISFNRANRIVFGTIGRMQDVKDQLTLCKAFVKLVNAEDEGRRKYGLIMVGDGPLRTEATRILEQAEMLDIAWLPGSRDDTPELLRSFDIFVLPSLAEGVSNTLLEAMATGLPSIATNVGGNVELVSEDLTGNLVERNNPEAMMECMRALAHDEPKRREYSAAARDAACNQFSLQRMVSEYENTYLELLSI